MTLDETDLRAAYFCVAEVVRRRRLSGQPIPSWLRGHFDRLDRAVRAAAASGQPIPSWLRGHFDRLDRAVRAAAASTSGHESGCAEQELQQQWLTATQAAQALGVSARHVRRLAADLDGQLVGGRWLFSADVVGEYAEERQRR
ncbi:helix-turn-helix domain-containing protein [Mycobacterium heckeshornense]|uniref:helix-turn-helix domain-containing protein n=1 Tax=Mycobacterium heckeshornense TaxID=110505 RepID=UPI0021F39DD3|nr:helix-turn-helix domain-containing protein [Mycobacterium heckeshornense]MCV7035125.1 helix-turn-helix domain-containing protein [Mycobacterium heckeshornense]